MDDSSDTDENVSSNFEPENDDNDSDFSPSEKTVKSKRIRKSNGKWKLYSENKTFKKEWQELYPWAEECADDPKLAKCVACNKKIRALKGILETHQKTKKHLKNLSGSDDIEVDEEEELKIKEQKLPHILPPQMPPHFQHQFPQASGMEHMMLGDDQISFFTDSPADAAHQAMTGLIDKLVEKYHENKLENLKIQNEAMLQLNVERANLIRAENQHKLERRLLQERQLHEAQEQQLTYMKQQHELRLSSLEDERDAKLKAVEQQLVYARQEYEKKMRLLDCQLSIMK